MTVTTGSLGTGSCHTIALSGSAAGNRATGEDIGAGNLCLDVRGGTAAEGQPLQLYTCKPNDINKRNQQWYLSGAIHGLGGQCLDIRGGRGYDNSTAQLFPCTGGDNQRWDYYFR